jgi:four helix bundle protein
MEPSEQKEVFATRLYQWTLRLIKLMGGFPRDNVSQIVIKQLLRSSTSILANYTEAKSARSRKDYINFFTYALKSANESEIWMKLLQDSGRGSKELSWLSGELVEISKILAKSIITLKKNM